MLCFRSEAHVNRWRESWHQPFGAMFPLETCWNLARAWYSQDRREPSWRRYSVDEAMEIFHGLGLTSDFWNLRSTTFR